MTPKISIITPWTGATVGDLLSDYATATEGAEIITVDNASPPADAAALFDYTTPRGVYLRNDTNAGFAAANNQGYAVATGDIVVFCNSDIAGDASWLAAVAADVHDGALYGPSLQQQLVAGGLWPYLEGWCIAATRATWEKLLPEEGVSIIGSGAHVPLLGPWDAESYPGPYWEDNDLCLRALEVGIKLIQTNWPVQHKGGRTAGALLRHAASFAANERTFSERALPHAARLATVANTPMLQRYQQYSMTPSDIQHHLPSLFALAHGAVIELGTRSGVSTAALLAGVEVRGGHVTSIDVDPRSAQVAAGHPQWTFIHGDTTSMALVDTLTQPIDLLLVDTLHTEAHVYRELTLWGPLVRPGGTIAIHDTETFPGVRVAVARYCAERGWAVTYVLPCNGMAFVEVR